MPSSNKKMILNNYNLTRIKFVPILIFIIFISLRDARVPQRAIDGGLFISGEISYPKNSLMFDSFNSSFTILHYLTAFLIKLNLQIYYISFILQFIQLFILAFSIYNLNIYLKNHLLLNYFSIFIILNAIPFDLKNLTFNYPLIINTEHTYGQYGLTFSLFIISLLLKNNFKFLVFILPFFISIHIGWAISTSVVLIIFILVKRIKINLTVSHLKFFLIGTLIQLPFWGHTLYLDINNLQRHSNKYLSNLYSTYINNWDYHRSFSWNSYEINLHLLIILILLLFTFLFTINNLNLNKFTLIAIINSLVSIFLVFLDNKFFNKSFITLNAFMPGKIINLSLILYVLIFVSIINTIIQRIFKLKLVNRILNLNYIMLLSFTLISFLVYSNINKFNFIKILPLDFSEYYLKDKELCDKISFKNIPSLTIGDASRFIPLNCETPILIDTTQIDFIPYARNSLPKLNEIMSEVFGLNFNSIKKSSEFVGVSSTPVGAIDINLVKPIWENRNNETWEYLSCKFNFINIVVPKDFSLKLPKVLSRKNSTIYKVSSNCNSQSNKFIGDFILSLPRETSNGGDDFYWITDQESFINIRQIKNLNNNLTIKFEILPNPCKNSYILEFGDKSSKNFIEVGSEKRIIEINLETWTEDYKQFYFRLNSPIKSCPIDGEVRNLVALIQKIEIEYAM